MIELFDQAYVYGATPPDAVIVAEPLFNPLQVTLALKIEAVNALGSEIVIEVTELTLKESVTVKL